MTKPGTTGSLILSGVLSVVVSADNGPPPELAGMYWASVESPGGPIPFALELKSEQGKLSAVIVNGTERTDVPEVSWTGDTLVLGITHYDSFIEANIVERLPPQGDNQIGTVVLAGKWRKRVGKDDWGILPFSAKPYAELLFEQYSYSPDDNPRSCMMTATVLPIDGRWSMRFASRKDPAIGVFRSSGDGTIEGTILTPSGDYRHLTGCCLMGTLRLSRFDGGHALLFHARMDADGQLVGEYWSRGASHDTWTAKRDDSAQLPEGFSEPAWAEGVKLSDLRFTDLDGKQRSLGDAEFSGHPLIIEIMGSWCPNCYDASRFLTELDGRYREKGLRIVGLAFEMTGDMQRDSLQAKRFAERTGATYPIWLGGVAESGAAAKAVPITGGIHAYPTAIFVRRDGMVRAVHSGYSGPATGEAYDELRKRFESIVVEMVSESAPKENVP